MMVDGRVGHIPIPGSAIRAARYSRSDAVLMDGTLSMVDDNVNAFQPDSANARCDGRTNEKRRTESCLFGNSRSFFT